MHFNLNISGKMYYNMYESLNKKIYPPFYLKKQPYPKGLFFFVIFFIFIWINVLKNDTI